MAKTALLIDNSYSIYIVSHIPGEGIESKIVTSICLFVSIFVPLTPIMSLFFPNISSADPSIWF